MNDRDEQLRQAVALFRYGLIADLAQLPSGARGHRREAAQESRKDLRHSRHAPHPGGR